MSYFIDARGSTVREVLSAEVLYRLPRYQRSYAWPVAAALQLLDDIVDAMQRRDSAGPAGSGYFFGTIVVTRPPGSRTAMIIDGQQRLMTLSILLAILRDSGSTVVAGTAGLFHDQDGAARLHPLAKDGQFFDEYVLTPGSTSRMPPNYVPNEAQEAGGGETAPSPTAADLRAVEEGGNDAEGDDDNDDDDDDDDDDEADDGLSFSPRRQPAHDSQHAILDNRNAIASAIGRLTQAKKPSIDELAAYVLTNCHLILVTVGDQKEAHRAFTVLHTRGIDLTETDVLKSELLGAIGSEASADRCQQVWEELESSLGRAGFDNLFSFLRMIKLKRRPREAVFKELRAEFQPGRNPQGFIENVLKPAGERLIEIRKGTYVRPGGDKASVAAVNRRLLRLALLPGQTWVPVAMLLLESYRGEPATLARLIAMLDTMAFGLAMIGGEDHVRRFAAVLRAIETRRMSDIEAALSLDPVESVDFAVRICRPRAPASNLRRLVLLRRLDSELVADGRRLPDYAGTNVEHVLPKSPGRKSNWLRWFAEPQLYLQSIGNLLVLPKDDNVTCGNSELDAKQKLYKAVHEREGYALLPEVCAASTWTPEIVQQRQQRFQDLLLALWGLRRPTLQGRKKAKRRRAAARERKVAEKNSGKSQPARR